MAVGAHPSTARSIRWHGLLLATVALAGASACSAVDSPPGSGGSAASSTPSSGASEVSADRTLFQHEDEGRVPIREIDSRSVGPVTVSEVSYPSPRGGTVTATMSVPVTDPEDVAVLLLHGMPLDRHDMRTPGIVYACAGATTLAIDAPYARSGRGSISFTPRDRADQIQLITDLRRGIDLLDEELGPNGARHVSLVGLSYGAAMAALLAGVDDRVGSAALIVGDGGLVAHMTKDDGTPTGQFSTVSEPRSSAWLDAMRPIEPLLYVSDSDAAFLFLNGRHDTQVDVADAEQLHAAAGDNSEVIWYDTGHDLNADAFRHQFHWVGERAGLDPERLAACIVDHASLDQ